MSNHPSIHQIRSTVDSDDDDATIQFYDFLQVMKYNSDDANANQNNRSCCSKPYDEKETDEAEQKNERWVPFIDFLAVGKCSSDGC